MPQGTLGDFSDTRPDEGEEECPHDDIWRYVARGEFFDGYRERRVYCNDCCSVIEQERLPLVGVS